MPRALRSCASSRVVVVCVFLALPPAVRGIEGRSTDVVVVEGHRFPADLRGPIEQLSLLRLRGGILEPVPFQIDERDEDLQLALPNGPAASHDESPGRFDDNDLLVFVAGDTGEAGTVDGASEIRVTDPLSGASGWVYLSRRMQASPPARNDVRYDPSTDTVHAARYTLRFGPNTPTHFAFSRDDGPTRNLLDRLKARVSARVLWGMLGFDRTEGDVTSTVLAWKDGPVRVVRRVQLRIRLGYGLPQPTIISEDIFTADAFEGPVVVRLPFDLRYVFGELTVRIFLDFDNLQGYRLFTAGHGPVAVGCGSGSDHLDGTPTDWFAMAGPEGAFVHVLQVSPTMQGMDRRLYLIGDDRSDPPETVPGNCPGVGYTLTRWSGIGRGTHHIGMMIRALDGDEPAAAEAAVARLRHPLLVEVQPAELQAADSTKLLARPAGRN
jgi:hypothetical protein